MRYFIVIFLLSFLSLPIYSQVSTTGFEAQKDHNFLFGMNAGMSCSYNDNAFNFAPTVSFSFDYHLINGYYLQFAPRYSWLYKWNEHYLTLVLHLRKRFGKRVSLFLGPCISWDVGFFNDLGISAGAYIHLGSKSAIMLSAFTFTLYDYNIDYTYIPVAISYNYYFN